MLPPAVQLLQEAQVAVDRRAVAIIFLSHARDLRGG